MNAKEKRSPVPIIPRSLDVQAADVLRDEILDGALAPGSRLLEIELSERLNLSRGTIRSALQQLIYEGLVVQFPYRGCTVVGLTAQDAWELYTLRNTLEGLASRLTAAAMTPAKAILLETALQDLIQVAQADDWQAIAHADFSLHKTIFQLSDHRRLQQQYQIVEQQIRLYIASCNALQADRHELVEQHIQLVKAICSGDTAIAEEMAKSHNTEGQLLIQHLKTSEKSLEKSSEKF
ncbi:MAG: GntR family transcriptional regulator [Leptolyngbyaceae cyanobacterium CRU_2_3]|nr:GntR family transcriptional regulator [Leptolyngbyaceae cyanobacterium CRU_2_3]